MRLNLTLLIICLSKESSEVLCLWSRYRTVYPHGGDKIKHLVLCKLYCTPCKLV